MTSRTVRAITPLLVERASKGSTLRDARLKGFTLSVTPGGKKVFKLRRGTPPNRVQVSLGEYPAVSPDEAYARALEALKNRERSGGLVAGVSWAEGIREYCRHHRTKRGKRPDETVRDRRRFKLAEGLVGTWSMPKTEPRKLAEALAPYEDRPQVHRMFRKLLSAVWGWCARNGLVDRGLPCPVNDISGPPVNSKGAAATPDERRAVLKALRSLDQPDLRLVLTILAETGPRPIDVLRLTWNEVHLNGPEGSYIELKERKAGDSVNLPLGPEAYAAAMACPDKTGRVARFTCGAREERWTPRLWRRWARWLRTVDDVRDDLTLYSLRRGVASALLEKGVALHEVAAVTGHSVKVLLEHYAKARTERVRATLKKLD